EFQDRIIRHPDRGVSSNLRGSPPTTGKNHPFSCFCIYLHYNRAVAIQHFNKSCDICSRGSFTSIKLLHPSAGGSSFRWYSLHCLDILLSICHRTYSLANLSYISHSRTTATGTTWSCLCCSQSLDQSIE